MDPFFFMNLEPEATILLVELLAVCTLYICVHYYYYVILLLIIPTFMLACIYLFIYFLLILKL